MKKLLLLLFLLMLPVAALADNLPAAGGPIMLTPPSEEIPVPRGISLSVGGSLETGKTATFTIKGTQSGTTYRAILAIAVDWTNIYQAVYDSSETSFSFHFYTPGAYGIWIYKVTGDTMDRIYYKKLTVTGTNLTAQRVQQIIAGCSETTDYGKALWLHDWLATNTYYDSTLCYHDAGVMLWEGYGVCQSYGEAYRALCLALGLSCEISSNYNHEWNEVNIDGEWYEVDVTWDTYGYAPAGSGSPSSDCDHIYFLLSDALLSYDHPSFERFHACTSMASNYYVVEGLADSWAQEAADFLAWSYEPSGTVECDVYNCFDTVEPYTDRHDIQAADVAVLLNGTMMQSPDGEVFIAQIDYVGSSYHNMDTTLLLSGTPAAAFTLPTDLEVIEAEAFCGTDAVYVAVPDGVTGIGSRAFADSSLRWIEFGSESVTIASDAFSGCSEELVFLVPDDTCSAAVWAQQHGISCTVVTQ